MVKDLRSIKKSHHSIILQRAWDKYGAENFIIKVLKYCNKDKLEFFENKFFKKLKPKYNICPIAYSQVGRKLSKEHIEKLKKYAKENNIRPPKETWESKRKSIIMLNYKTGEEIKEFISVTEACNFIGKNFKFVSTLTQVCKGKRKSAFGYKWKFKIIKN